MTKSNYVKTTQSTFLTSNQNTSSNVNLKYDPIKALKKKKLKSKDSASGKFDIVEKLMRKHEAMVKQVMKQKDHLASNFTT